MENHKPTQNQRVLDYINEFGSIQTLRELNVIKMQSEIESRCVKKGIYQRVVDDVGKEMLEDNR